ncbi:MAG: Gfo/Idh/MocA family oxidoreductase [Thermoguttaceae bacterium]|nr:Gfo/Idh/MocA family oxidoreductase [Thermoguttaceae bacterium]MDW8039489.1 Gfo/Idh/MocA family oxidoreductase [Thermoguttaceae bacterium]
MEDLSVAGESKLRMAVIGAGRLGSFHAQKLAARQDVQLVAVVDPVPAQRNRLAGLCRTQALAHHRQLFGQVDAAVVAAPTCCHYQIGRDLLQAGIHCLMEKPLAARLEEADELVELARHHGLVLQVGHIERFNPAFEAALPFVRNPKYIEAVRAGPYSFRSTDIGVVLDLMIHDIELALTLTHASVRRVEALGLSVLGGHEDVANARIEFTNGCIATLSACRVAYEAVRYMHIWAPGGFARIDFANRMVRLVRPSQQILQRRLRLENLCPEEIEAWKLRLVQEHLPCQCLQFDTVDALALELEDFITSIRLGRSPRVTGQQGRDALAVAEMILEKISTHVWEEGLVGPLATPAPTPVPMPHWPETLLSAETPPLRKAAG